MTFISRYMISSKLAEGTKPPDEQKKNARVHVYKRDAEGGGHTLCGLSPEKGDARWHVESSEDGLKLTCTRCEAKLAAGTDSKPRAARKSGAKKTAAASKPSAGSSFHPAPKSAAVRHGRKTSGESGTTKSSSKAKRQRGPANPLAYMAASNGEAAVAEQPVGEAQA